MTLIPPIKYSEFQVVVLMVVTVEEPTTIEEAEQGMQGMVGKVLSFKDGEAEIVSIESVDDNT